MTVAAVTGLGANPDAIGTAVTGSGAVLWNAVTVGAAGASVLSACFVPLMIDRNSPALSSDTMIGAAATCPGAVTNAGEAAVTLSGATRAKPNSLGAAACSCSFKGKPLPLSLSWCSVG